MQMLAILPQTYSKGTLINYSTSDQTITLVQGHSYYVKCSFVARYRKKSFGHIVLYVNGSRYTYFYEIALLGQMRMSLFQVDLVINASENMTLCFVNESCQALVILKEEITITEF